MQEGSSVLPHNLSDTPATSQDGSSLDFIQAIAGRQCYIQDASGRGLCWVGLDDIIITSFSVASRDCRATSI